MQKTLGQIFCVECAVVKKTLLAWFNRKFKSQYLQISTFPLKVEPTNYQTPENEMTFGEFIIRYEHKFLRNI